MKDAARFQYKVWQWFRRCFDTTEYVSRHTPKASGYRFLEEALELCQCVGVSRKDAVDLVDYVYNRPVGVPYQECGGVMLTFIILAEMLGISAISAGESELDRVCTPAVMEKIRRKQREKIGSNAVPSK